MDKKGVACITGGVLRVGREIALELARRGYALALHSRSGTGREDLAAELRSLGCDFEIFEADFCHLSQVERLSQDIKARFPRISLLVHSASSWPDPELEYARSSFVEETEQRWDEAIAVDARAPFFLTQHLLPQLGESALVLSIIDESVHEPFFHRVGHSVAKAASLHVSRVLAQVLSDRLRICALELGPVLPSDNLPEEARAKLQWAGPERVAKLVADIAADAQANKRWYKFFTSESRQFPADLMICDLVTGAAIKG